MPTTIALCEHERKSRVQVPCQVRFTEALRTAQGGNTLTNLGCCGATPSAVATIGLGMRTMSGRINAYTAVVSITQ